QQKTELPVTENIQTIPPPYVVRTILVYSRPVCQPPVVVTDQMKVPAFLTSQGPRLPGGWRR
ncbi:putative BRISC and BRCA1-A complex member 1-like protein, partial [Naja naja]